MPYHHDSFLSNPRDSLLDADGNLWVVFNPALKKFSPTGEMLTIFPEVNPWESGESNDRFNDPFGIAQDADGRIYVADLNNHRIQVYETITDTLVFSTTIGVTGEIRTDNSGFNRPAHINFDGSGRLLVADTSNHRIQRCTYVADWTCTTIAGVSNEPGDDLSHLSNPNSVAADTGDAFYVADSGNRRLLYCTSPGNCSIFAGETGVWGLEDEHFTWISDVDVNAVGTVFVSDTDAARVKIYSSTGIFLRQIGVTGVPYLTDPEHFNAPWGLYVYPDGGLLVAENGGKAIKRYAADGSQTWTVGTEGRYGSGDEQFGSWWAGLEGRPGVDSAGTIYVPDTGNNRIQVFDSSGVYQETWNYEDGTESDWSCPTGVDIDPVTGNFAVTDHCNHRVQVFDSTRAHVATIGETGVVGTDLQHLDNPWDAVWDAQGNIFIADSENYRVLKCTPGVSDYTCTQFLGVTDEYYWQYDHVRPVSLDVDAQGRVFIIDEWSTRVLVFNASGALLTTLYGQWGWGRDQRIGMGTVVVTDDGLVYVSDYNNHHIQVFHEGYLGWQQANVNGFGSNLHGIASLAEYDGKLYAGTGFNSVIAEEVATAQVWVSSDGASWTEFSPPAAAVAGDVIDLEAFKGDLYASVWLEDNGQIWRTDGASWDVVVPDGFGDPDNGVDTLAVFDGYLYVSTYNDVSGSEFWRSDTGDLNDWEIAMDGNFGAGVVSEFSFAVYDGELYAGFGAPAAIWHSANGTDWTPLFTNGLGDGNNTHVWGLGVFQDQLYFALRNPSEGGEVWRYDGASMEMVFDGGLGNPENGRPYSLFEFQGRLWVVFNNYSTGVEIWNSLDGEQWQPAMRGGWNLRHNLFADYIGRGHAVFQDKLYLGTLANQVGGQVWQFQNTLMMPLTVKAP